MNGGKDAQWPAKGDRVMYDDATWTSLGPVSRRVGRRGGTCTGRCGVPGYVYLRWDGRKSTALAGVDQLCPFDPAKDETLYPPLRDLVGRLREYARIPAYDGAKSGGHYPYQAFIEAADEIERLRGALLAFRSLVKEAAGPRYAIEPGKALDGTIENIVDPVLFRDVP